MTRVEHAPHNLLLITHVLVLSHCFFFLKKEIRGQKSCIVGPLILQFWTSGDVSWAVLFALSGGILVTLIQLFLARVLPSSHVVNERTVIDDKMTMNVDENKYSRSGVHRYVGGKQAVLHP